jgi:hypothetical protein
MAVPLQATNGTPLPVSWIREDQADPFIVCSQSGGATVQDGGTVTKINTHDLFGASLDAPLGCAVVVIFNTLRRPLDLVEMYLKDGSQHGYPAVTDLKGGTLTPHQIPAARLNPLDGSKMFGAGMWSFDGSGTEVRGAMKFCTNGKLASPKDDTQPVGPFLGVAFNLDCIMGYGMSPQGKTAVTADVEGNHGSLQKFYTNTADDHEVRSEIGKEITIIAAHGLHGDSSGSGRWDFPWLCVTVYVRYKLPNE